MKVLKRLIGFVGLLLSAALFPVISIVTIIGWGFDKFLNPYIYILKMME